MRVNHICTHTYTPDTHTHACACTHTLTATYIIDEIDLYQFYNLHRKYEHKSNVVSFPVYLVTWEWG